MSEELAGRLLQLRDATGRSLRELARDVHVSSSSLSRYFSGQAVPPWPTVVALCKSAGHDPRTLREVWERAKDGPRTSAAGPAPVRNDLPHDITAFTGRGEELNALFGAARNTSVVAIDGMGGVGKSALAVHAAHRLTVDFPGGQLYLDLHGFTWAGSRSGRRRRCVCCWPRSGCRQAGFPTGSPSGPRCGGRSWLHGTRSCCWTTLLTPITCAISSPVPVRVSS